MNKIIFELQTTDWRRKQPIPDQGLAAWMRNLKQVGIQNLAYYPDDFLNNQPALRSIKPVFSVQQ